MYSLYGRKGYVKKKGGSRKSFKETAILNKLN